MLLKLSFRIRPRSLYGETIEEIGKSAIFQAPVVVQRNRILRTRAKFDELDMYTLELEIDPELVDIRNDKTLVRYSRAAYWYWRLAA